VNGEVAANGEATVLAVADGLESGEVSMSVGGSKANATGILKGLCEVGFSAKGVNGGVEFAKLILALAEACDVGGEPPIAQFVGHFLQMGIASGAPLKEAKEPGAHRLCGEQGIFNRTSE